MNFTGQTSHFALYLTKQVIYISNIFYENQTFRMKYGIGLTWKSGLRNLLISLNKRINLE
jgi:hypothetical protein